LRSSYFAPLTLAVIVVPIVGISVQLLALAGMLPGSRAAQSRAAQSRVVITGPGRTGNGDQIQAYVLGTVVSPGVYAPPHGSRVHDLVAAVGSATVDADLARVSLAGEPADGGTVYSPRVGATIPATLGGTVNITSASERDVRYALGAGSEIARRIVAYRTAHGTFTAISQLLLVTV
jgi:competence protein ComEA